MSGVTFRRAAGLILAAGILLFTGLEAASLPAPEVVSTTGIDLPELGRIKPRPAREIASSPWSIGGETLDRDFAVYAHYRSHLGPLGAKGIRLQAGWAKCEKQPGVYDWAWLDLIIDDARAQGVQPWIELSYGNAIYPGGGGVNLGGGFPSSPEALAAWDRWALALVRRYKDRVFEWEIWNEPDANRTGAALPAAYVDLHIRTATMIRAEQPQSRIYAMGLAHTLDYADQVLAGLHAWGRLDLVDAITIHGYPPNPDDTTNIDLLRAMIARYGHPIAVRQGETGAPSRYQESFALRNLPWSETMQAKWNIRRMLAHRAKDVPMNLFSMSDMHYTRNGQFQMNYKGLVGTNPDQTVSRVKAAYHAAQTVCAIFDDTLQRLPEYPFTASTTRGLALAGYGRVADGAQAVALWFNGEPPVETTAVTPTGVTLGAGRFTEPVLVDLRTGVVYALPPDRWAQKAGGAFFYDLPLYDSPVLIAEKALLRIVPVAAGLASPPPAP